MSNTVAAHSSDDQRLFGLDLIRAAAIILVILAHGSNFPGNPFSWVPAATSRLGWVSGVVGVEMFFCLSGFLIGILMSRITHHGITPRSAWIFLLRRWMRTLPLYYLVLLALVLFPVLEPSQRPAFWPYALLVQNAVNPMPASNWFGTSWSLVIEEWSYIVVAALALITARFHRHPILLVAIILCVAGTVFRLWGLHLGGDWDTSVRKMFLTRLDAIAWGMILAWFWFNHQKATLAWARASLPASLPLLVVLVWIISRPDLLSTDFGRIAVLPLFAAALCMVMPTIIILPAPNIIKPIITFLARISYTLYLVHWSVMFLVPQLVSRGWQFICYIGLSVAVATILTVVIERPVLRLRPRQV